MTTTPPRSPGAPGEQAGDGTRDAFEAARAVADAVLFEGYLLYPYRRSSAKNKVRFQFGVLLPRSCTHPGNEAMAGTPTVAGSAESSFQQTETLVEPRSGGSLTARVRFLHLQRRTVEQRAADGWARAERLEVGGQVHLSFDEAVERHVDLSIDWGESARASTEVTASFAPEVDVDKLCDDAGRLVGRVVRRTEALALRVALTMEPVEAPFRLARLRVETRNTSQWSDPAAPRDDALARALLATHTMAAASGGRFVSLLDPPEWATPAASACANRHTFPVLVGDPGSRNLLLSSPIILYDHPEVAPESPGDLFDAAEIDEILSLRTLTLTDDEKAEARATDPRAAAILDRADAMPPEILARLHGVIRTMEALGPARGHEPRDEVVLSSGEHARPGSLVRLRPRSSGTDAGDMFLAGRVARIASLFDDVDGRRHVAVTLPEDPGADLQQWYGRYFYFSPDEMTLDRGPDGGPR